MQPKSSISRSSSDENGSSSSKSGNTSGRSCVDANWEVAGSSQASRRGRHNSNNNSKVEPPAGDCQGQGDADHGDRAASMNKGQSAEATTLGPDALQGDRAFGTDDRKPTRAGLGSAREIYANESSAGSSSNDNNTSNNNSNRIVVPATEQVGDNHLLDAELAVGRQKQQQQQHQQQQQQQHHHHHHHQWRQDKLSEDDDRGSELVNDSIRAQSSALAIDSDRTVSDSRFVGSARQKAPSHFSDQQQQRQPWQATPSSSSAAPPTAEAAAAAAVAAAPAYRSGAPSVGKTIVAGAAGPAGCGDPFRVAAKRRSSLDSEHVLALLSDSQKQQKQQRRQQHQHLHQSRQQQSSFDQNNSSQAQLTNSGGDSSQLADNTRQQQKHQRIKVTLSKPKQEPRRKSLGESQDTEVEAKLGEFYTVNPSLQSQRKQKQWQREEEEEEEKQNSTITITEQILVQDESSTTTPTLADDICCRNSIATPTVTAAVATTAATTTLISPIDSIESQSQSQSQPQRQPQPQTQAVKQHRGEHRGERVKRAAPKQNGADSRPLAAATTITSTKLSRSEQEDLLRRIASQRRRNLDDGEPVGPNNDSSSNATTSQSPTTPAASVGSGSGSGARQAKQGRQCAKQSISKSILNTKRQSEDNGSGELNLLDSDFLIPSQPSVTRDRPTTTVGQQKKHQQPKSPSACHQQQQQQQQQQEQKNCPKQLAIYINGKIRSNSIFCSRSVSSNSFSSLLKGFHSSTSDQQQQRRPQQSAATSIELASDSISSGRKQIIVPDNRLREGNKSQEVDKNKKTEENSTRAVEKDFDVDDDDSLSTSSRGQDESKSKSKKKKKGKERKASRYLVRRSIAPNGKSSSLVTFLQNLNLNSRNIFSGSRGIKCGGGDKGHDSAGGQFDLEQGERVHAFDQSQDQDQSGNRRRGAQEQPQKTYKLNPSSMFLRKAMRYYRLWIYSANLTILSGTIIFVLSTLYVTSDYRTRLIIAPPSAPPSPYLSPNSHSGHIETRPIDHHSPGDEQQTGNTYHRDPFEATAQTRQQSSAADYSANKSSDDSGAQAATTASKHHEFSISLNEPTMLVAYVIIALQLGLLQAIGCFGAIRTKERLIQAFWYIILLLVLFDVVFLFYWLQRYNFMLKSLQAEMTYRLQHQYGRRDAMLNSSSRSSSSSSNSSNSFISDQIGEQLSSSFSNNISKLGSSVLSSDRGESSDNDHGQSGTNSPPPPPPPPDVGPRIEFDEIFTEIFDRIQAESHCCGMRNSADYKRSRWRDAKLAELQARLKEAGAGAPVPTTGQETGAGDELNKDDHGDDHERERLIELLYQVPLVPASCCRRPPATGAGASSTAVNRERPPPSSGLLEEVSKKPVISYPDDSQLPQKVRVPAWSPSMVVDNLVTGPSSGLLKSRSTWTSGEGRKNNKYKDAGSHPTAKTTAAADDDDEQDNWGPDDVLVHVDNDDADKQSDQPTLADVIDRRWTGRHWSAGLRDEVGTTSEREDEGDGEGTAPTELDSGTRDDIAAQANDEPGDAESGYNSASDNNKIYKRLKAKQRHYGLESGPGEHELVSDRSRLARDEVKQFVGATSDNPARRARSKRGASDEDGWAVETSLDARGRVLARLIELIDSSSNGTYNASASRLSSMWPLDDVDSGADERADDEDAEPGGSGMQISNRKEVLTPQQADRRARKAAIGRQLNRMRQMLFVNQGPGPGREGMGPNTFKWPNELQLSYEQFKLIETFILNEVSVLSDGEASQDELASQKNRAGSDPKEKVVARRSIEAEDRGNTQAQRRRHAKRLRLIRELISHDEELGGASCLPRSHYDEARIYTRGCQHTIRAWLQSSANILFVMGFCVLTVLKFCSLILLRLEISEMIHKIRVLKGMATEYNALQDLEPYLPRPSICAQAAELTPAGVTAVLAGANGAGGGPVSCSSLAGAVGATNAATASTGVLANTNTNSSSHSPTHAGSGPPRRLGGSFSEAVAAATAVVHQQRLAAAEAHQQQFNHLRHHRHYGRAGSLINCARAVSTKTIGGCYGGTSAGGGGVSAGGLTLSACPSVGTMLTAPLTGARRASRVNSTSICPCVSSSLSVAHFGQAAGALQHYQKQACSLRSDLFPAASSMPRRHTAISVCPAAAAAAAAAAAGIASSNDAPCSQQYLLVRRGTYSPVADSLIGDAPGAGGQRKGSNYLGAGNAGLKAQSGTINMDNLLEAQSLNYLSQHRHSAYAGTIQTPPSLLFGGAGGGGDVSAASSRRPSRVHAGDETIGRSASPQEDQDENGNNEGARGEKEHKGRRQQMQRPAKHEEQPQQQQQQQQQLKQRQLLSLNPGRGLAAAGTNPPPFKRQSSGGAQSAVNFSLDISPPNLAESRRSIH